MQFAYHSGAGAQTLRLCTKEYAHLFKVRRITDGAQLDFCNLADDTRYTYKITNITKKEASLELIETKRDDNAQNSALHVGWCLVDPKTIEKTLAMLNEMGVATISFVYADFSQKNYKLDTKRIERILINSCEQCGRTNLMRIEILESVECYLKQYPQSAIIDFDAKRISQDSSIVSFLVGPEGGFSGRERKLFEGRDIYGLGCDTILRSETVVVGVCAKLTL